MGLDMYAYRKGKCQSKEEMTQIAEWRKHNRLHGYMTQLWIEKGLEKGKTRFADDFNCVNLRLKKKDIRKLANMILGKALPNTSGFFFGSDSYEHYSHYLKEDLKFIFEAKKAIKNGDKVYYSSWW
jgi:hypothetical protein